jgi:hypothetical protein
VSWPLSNSREIRMTDAPESDDASPEGRLGGAGRGRAGTGALLVILCAVQFFDAYDIAAIGPALPKIQSDLDIKRPFGNTLMQLRGCEIMTA